MNAVPISRVTSSSFAVSASIDERSDASIDSFWASAARRDAAVEPPFRSISSDSLALSALDFSFWTLAISPRSAVTSSSILSPCFVSSSSCAAVFAAISVCATMSAWLWSRERRTSMYPPVSAPLRFTWSPSSVMQSSSCDLANLAPTSSVRTTRHLRKTCWKALRCSSRNFNLWSIGITSSDFGYGGLSPGAAARAA